MSLRQTIGALVYDWPRFSRAMRSGRWELMHNRNERISTDGRGVKCEWRFTSDLHIAKVFPRAGILLMREAFERWPVVMADEPVVLGMTVSFIVGHRGLDRLPHLLTTLRSIAGQRDVAFECIVVEQGATREIEGKLPSWVRYVFEESHQDYSRSSAFNRGAEQARGEYLILHDNDMVVPSRYAAEVVARGGEGFSFIDVKRFLFNLDESATRTVFDTGVIPDRVPSTIVQNAQGGSVAAGRKAYFEIGGFDEEFVGWGGEDNDFWDRAATQRVYQYGYVPMIHLYHAPQAGKVAGPDAPAIKLYRERETVPAHERIRRLLFRRR
jgi:glycosyl transferase family 7 (putative galactosyltransferase)